MESEASCRLPSHTFRSRLSPVGPVKKCGLLKILHEKYRPATGVAKQRVIQEVQEFRFSLTEAAEANAEIEPHIGKAQVRGGQLVVPPR